MRELSFADDDAGSCFAALRRVAGLQPPRKKQKLSAVSNQLSAREEKARHGDSKGAAIDKGAEGRARLPPSRLVRSAVVRLCRLKPAPLSLVPVTETYVLEAVIQL